MRLVIRETETTALESPEVALLTPQRPCSGCSIFLPLYLFLYTANISVVDTSRSFVYFFSSFFLFLSSLASRFVPLSLSLALDAGSAGRRDALP